MALRGALDSLLALPPGPAFKAPTAQVINLSLGANIIARTGEDYICATTDWWPPNKCDYGVCAWSNTPYGLSLIHI